MPATIKDIAKKVGVNPSTVSRVINGTASISEETRQKIKDAMKELDYHPNSLARSLVNGSTFTIGLVIDAGNSDAFSNAFFIRSVSAIEAVTQQRGFNLLITSDSDKEDNSAVKNLILEKKIDGIILPVSAATEELIDLLLGNHFPFIVLGEPDNVRDGINGIMNNKCFWATKNDFLNDPKEFLYVNKILKKVLINYIGNDDKIGMFLEDVNKSGNSEYFVLSFSCCRDSITMWAEFGKSIFAGSIKDVICRQLDIPFFR